MAKISLANILSGFSLTRINDNFEKIEEVINNNVMFRDNPSGEDNTLVNDVDMNGRKLYNLPAPTGDSHAARLQDVKNAIAGISGYVANLISFSPTAVINANNVQGAIEEVGVFSLSPGGVSGRVSDAAKDVYSVTTFLPRNFVKNGSVDYTTYVQKAVDALPVNGELLIPQGVNVAVTRIKIDSKSDFAIRVDGKITNIAPKPGAAASDVNTSARGLNATFYIVDCHRFKVYGAGRVNPGYREAFCIGERLPENSAAPCSDFEISVDVYGAGSNDNMHANRIRYCSRFALTDMTLDGLTKKPTYVNAATAYYYNWAENLLLWDCTDFSLRGLRISNSGMNGIYVGSNCERFDIGDCDITHCAGSAIQLAWSSFGMFPKHFTIRGNRAGFNRADAWDLNNTGPLLDVFGVVTDNFSYYNGWGTEDTACTSPTNDGSGIGTYINLKKMTVTNNIDHECSHAGGYFSFVWDTSVTDNIITKEAAASKGEGIYLLRCTNIDVVSNNVNTIPSRAALIVYGDNASQGNIRVDTNYFYGQVTFDGGSYSGSFNHNKAICPNQITMPIDAIDNDITVTGAGQIGLYVSGDNRTIERNRITANGFAIVAYGLWAPKILSNYCSGSGGIRVDSCAFGKVNNNYGKAVGSPGIHLLGTCNNMEVSSNQGDSVSGNSLRVEATCTNTHKWANRNVNGPSQYDGTYGINF